ncbi:timeless protein-domain-containing protein [Syncephalis plumigaleata]|nr:timeless protein-domain-containing protein [Syncephalis plumigaleata]
MHIMTLDLLPILLNTYEGQTEDQDLICGACLELLVPLTWPPEKTLPWLTERRQQLWSYKYAFIHERALPALFTILTRWLSIPYVERSERRQALIRLLMTLIRNLLAIEDPCAPTSASADTLKHTHMQVDLIKELHRTSFVRLFLVMASSIASQEFSAWNLLLLEIIQLIFTQTTADRLVNEAIDAKAVHLQTDLLSKELQKEERIRRDRKRNAPSRHSRFGGAITEKMADGTQYNILRQFTPHLSFHNAIEPMKKPKTVTAKLWTFEQKQYQSDKELNKLLYQTAETIICSCFNPMVASLRYTVDIGRPDVLNEDSDRFFSFIAFFIEFQLLVMSNDTESSNKDMFMFEHCAEALSLRTVLCQIKRIQQCRDLKLYTELAHPVNAFHQTLRMIQLMFQSSNSVHRATAETLRANIFYEKMILDLMVQLYQIPSAARHPAYLIDLVAMIHSLLKMLEHYSQERQHLFVRQHRSGKRKRSRKNKDNTEEDREEEEGDNDENSHHSNEDEDDEDEDNSASIQIASERQFEFSRFQMGFARESIVQAYCILLEQLPRLDISTVKHIVSMFHRLFVTCQCEWLFYKLSVLQLFDQILDQLVTLNNEDPVYNALQQFIHHCIGRFIKTWQRRPLLAIEVFFPKWHITPSNTTSSSHKRQRTEASSDNLPPPSHHPINNPDVSSPSSSSVSPITNDNIEMEVEIPKVEPTIETEDDEEEDWNGLPLS